MYVDKSLICRACGAGFIFTAGEQDYYARHGLVNEPKHCKACRRSHAPGESREYSMIICANCGTTARVPFKPSGGRPVYCRECLRALSEE